MVKKQKTARMSCGSSREIRAHRGGARGLSSDSDPDSSFSSRSSSDSSTTSGASLSSDSTDPKIASLTKEDDAAWEERAGVRAEIEALLAKHNAHPEIEPPFSPGEFIVMAVLSSRKRAMFSTEIITWIIKTVVYFRDRVLNEVVSETGRQSVILEDLRTGFDTWEAPLVWAESEESTNNEEDEQADADIDQNEDDGAYGTRTETSVSAIRVYYDTNPVSVPTAAGRIFLRRYLEPERKGNFRFLELPAEIRNTIYEYALTLPESGIDCSTKATHGCLPVFQREMDEPKTMAEARERMSIRTSLIQDLLAVLLVNRQIFSEAMPSFYSSNNFVFYSIYDILNLAKQLAPERFQHIGGLIIKSYMPSREYIDPKHRKTKSGKDLLRGAARSIAALKHLRQVEIVMDGDVQYPQSADEDDVDEDTNPEHLLGMKDLAIAGGRAAVFKVDGDFELLREYMVETARKSKKAKLQDEKAEVVEKRRRESSKGAVGPTRKSARLQK